MSCKGWENCILLSDLKIGLNLYIDLKIMKVMIDDIREGMIVLDFMLLWQSSFVFSNVLFSGVWKMVLMFEVVVVEMVIWVFGVVILSFLYSEEMMVVLIWVVGFLCLFELLEFIMREDVMILIVVIFFLRVVGL